MIKKDNTQVLLELNTLLAKDKFSSSSWKERGLNPSSTEICHHLDALFDNCLDELIDAVNTDRSSRSRKKILIENLARFDKSSYDTEEKEFIADYFFQISNILSIDFKNQLNMWLYGRLLVTLMNIVNFFKGEPKIIETYVQDCADCKAPLKTYVMRKSEGLASNGWMVVQCNKCREYNLIQNPKNSKENKFGEYKYIESLSRIDYSEETAQKRIVQIRQFRKR